MERQSEEDAALAVRSLRVDYGGVTAIEQLSMTVPVGGCTALIGANGAGKTSTLRAISGLTSTRGSTEVWFRGRRIDRLTAEARARLGLAHVLEGRHLFANLSVRHNLELGLVARRPSAARMRERLDAVSHLFPEMTPLLDVHAGALSGGQQQFVAVARAMMMEPQLLILDEPSTGLAPQLIIRLIEILQQLIVSGTPLLLAEQSLELVARTATTVHILQHGRIVHTTTGDDQALESIARRVYLE